MLNMGLLKKARLCRGQLTVHIRDFFRNMPFKIFAILAVFAICLSSITYSAFSGKRNLNPPTEIAGFLPFAIVDNGQGIINSSEDSILIEAVSASEPRVTAYASSANFKWDFCATPLLAKGNSNPIVFSIDWKFGNFSVWANMTHGWYYSHNATNNWGSNGIYLGSALKLESRYLVDIEWNKLSEAVSLSLSISNYTWQTKSLLNFALPPNSRIECANLILGASANQSARSIVIFDSSHFISYNLSDFTQPTVFDLCLLFIGSFVMWIITIVVFVEKFWQFPLAIRLFSHKLGLSVSSLNIKESVNKLISNIKCNSSVLLLFTFFGGLRLILASFSNGHLFDTHAMETWLSVIQSKGLVSIYPFSDVLPPYLGIRPVYPYPPIIAYVLSLINGLPDDASLASLLIKLPAIIADLLLGLTVFLTFKNREGLIAALPALFLSLLNFVNSSIWGQYDSIVALFMVLSVWLVATDRIELGWIFAALAVATKQTALILMPGLLILSIRQKRCSRLFYGFLMFAAVVFIIWYPFLQNGFSLDFAMGALGLRLWSPGGGLDPISPEGGGGTSIWAFNIWPLITLLLNRELLRTGIIGVVKDTLPNQFFVFSYFQLGAIIFALAYVLLLIRIWKAFGPRNVMLQFGLLMLAFYMLPTRIHERYLIFALCFLPFAYNKSKRIMYSYLVLLATYGLSLGYALITGVPEQNWISITSSLIYIVLVECGLFALISINILVFLLLIFRYSDNNVKTEGSEKISQG